jgi:hypothetical protein
MELCACVTRVVLRALVILLAFVGMAVWAGSGGFVWAQSDGGPRPSVKTVKQSEQKLSQGEEILPLAQVRAGMHGYAETIFAGDEVEKFDLEVIGVMPNFLGPRQSIILVQLKGAKVERTGVVAGMSGSPVYLEGKLAGALSLKLGQFTKDPIGGVTPIEDVMRQSAVSAGGRASGGAGGESNGGWSDRAGANARGGRNNESSSGTSDGANSGFNGGPGGAAGGALSGGASGNSSGGMSGGQAWGFGTGTGNGSQNSLLAAGTGLQPIETPLIFSGFQAATLQQFAPQIQSYGFVATQGGTSPARADDGHLVAGDMAGMVLVQGDASVNSACTVTAVRGDRVYLCGHPFLSLGDVQLPMARSRVVMTLASDLASTKIVDVGGVIGTITGDHLTAVTGKLGAPPVMIPLEVSLTAAGVEKKLHFEVVNHPKLTPFLVALTTFNGLTQNAIYGEGTTLHFTGEIRIRGHAPVQVESTYAPGDSLNPDATPIALSVQNIFTRLFVNTYEVPAIEGISLKVESVPGRRSFGIESAWLEKGEAAPGETLRVRVLLHPYRGAARIEETTVRVPEQIARGTTLRVLVTDGETLNRASRGFAFGGGSAGPEGLDQLIAVLNRERRNDRFYVGLFVPSPTILWDDKEMPNVPLSQINILDGRPAPGSVQVLRDSLASESSIALGGQVSGVISLNLQIR